MPARISDSPAGAMYISSEYGHLRQMLCRLLFYTKGDTGEATDSLPMKKAESGTWLVQSSKATPGLFYAFRVRIGSTWLDPVPDPYAKSVGVNGKRACIVDLSATNPDGWFYDFMPAFGKATDAIIYELHIRDASISPARVYGKKANTKGWQKQEQKMQPGFLPDWIISVKWA